jgi:porin
MTGDWGGTRTQLEDMGIIPHFSYLGEDADVLSGGKRQGNGYAQQLAFGSDIDMNKLAGLGGGTLRINFTAREGRSTSTDYIGNEISVQETYGAGENFRLAEISYEQMLAGGLVDLKGGFYPMGNDFAHTPLLCVFQNDAFCAHPTILPLESGWSDNPTGQWGGRVLLNPTPWLYAESGIYDSNPTHSAHNNGLKISLAGSTGALIPSEVGFTTNAFNPAFLPGHYKIGGYYDTSSAADVVDTHTKDYGRYGGYFLADQMVWSFDGEGQRGAIIFLQEAVADARTAAITNEFLTGLIIKGPFESRPKDSIYFGYSRTKLNHRLLTEHDASLAAADTNELPLDQGETAFEVGYNFQAAPWLLLHPNFQYIGNPGTFSYQHIPDAWVFGMQTSITF